MRLNSTRVFWDPTYTDPNFPQPNYITDANYTSNCSTPLQAPHVIPMMKKWVANDYPGTKLAITEYNWGGQESISGALAQADILGIFGREGLDIGTLWGAPDPLRRFPASSPSRSSATTTEPSQPSATRPSPPPAPTRASSPSTSAAQQRQHAHRRRHQQNLWRLHPCAQPRQLHRRRSSAVVPLQQRQPERHRGPTQHHRYRASGGSTTSTLSTTFPAQSITILVVPKA